jgi:hypothetical protein
MQSLATNPSFWSALFAWLAAQLIKMSDHYIHTRKFDISYLVSTGGMPSAHSAMVCGLTTSVGIRAGMDSPLFAVTLAFALVVMFDAQSVRRAAGQQARVLNQLIEQLFKEHQLNVQKLGELLGHTRKEVAIGMMLGIVVALLVHAICNSPLVNHIPPILAP